MPLIPDPPFPKSQGDNIRSKDWNDAINEVRRLDTAKLNLSGGAVTGPLNISGALGIGTTTPNRPLTIQSAAETFLNVRSTAGGGPFEVLLGVDSSGGVVSTMTNHDLQLRAGGNDPKLVIKASGNVGIGTPNPDAKLDVRGDIRAGNSDLYFTKTDHDHTGIGNTEGFAAIENAANWNALMILGRASAPPLVRTVKLWDYLQVMGDAEFSGNIGTHGYSAKAANPNWGGGIHTFDIEAEGTISARYGVQPWPPDLAENYYSDLDLAAGDVICLDKHQDRIVPSGRANDDLVIGVISTQPGVLLNSNPDSQPPHPGWLPYPVALSGRVPCKVTDENGPIERGDLLTSSSVPGHAMKAKPIVVDGQPIYRPGTLIGKALESLASGKGMVDIFVCLR